MESMIGRRVQILDEQDHVIFMRALKEGEYDRLLRLLELLSDKEVSTTLDDIIKNLEAPKREIASQISHAIAKAKNLEEVLTEALIVLPKAQLEEITQRIDRLEFERKPDCLVIKADEKTWSVPI